jgi:hypothetical protein
MPLGLRRGTVSALVEEQPGLVRLEVDAIPCVAYPRLTGPVELGDDVLVNEQTRLLELGSGGFDVLYANLTRGLGLPPEDGAHVIALPYTPGQVARQVKEETDALAESLDGMPVVLCTLHSQVVPVCAGLRGARVAYVQVQGGALPVPLSDAVRALKDRRLIDIACAVAPCVDADADFVTVAAALAWAAEHGYGAVVVAVGPGIVGTGTRLGHGAIALADVANAATALGGRPVLAVRTSDADSRDRHRGVSHHARAVLDLALGDVLMPVAEDGEGWESACEGLPLSHMGRGPADDPSFFRAAYAAGVAARRLAG